jgi:hypothetical protein
MSAGPSLPSRAFLASSPISWLIWKMPFLSASLITGTTRPLGVSAAKPMWKYFFSTSWSPSSAGVELGNFFSAATGLDHEGQHRDLDAALLVLLVQLHAEGFQLGDVGIVVVGDVRDHHPVAVQVGAADLLDARQVLALDRAELGEVDLRPGQQAGEGPPLPPAAGAGALAFCAGLHIAGHHALDEALHVVLRDAALGAAAATSASGTPSSRARRRTVGEACGSRPWRRWVRARARRLVVAAAAGAGAAATGALQQRPAQALRLRLRLRRVPRSSSHRAFDHSIHQRPLGRPCRPARPSLPSPRRHATTGFPSTPCRSPP